ncbi:MAG: ImmA/IrrE family metallo-endopeptidase [Clostridiales bacterium]|nr:ImmA/IrrE family metallo-endopeptidase [Clostridiales bacterium]
MEERDLIEDVVKEIRKHYQIPCPILDIDEVVKKLGIQIEENWEYLSPKRINDSFVISPGLNNKNEQQRNLRIAKDIGHLFLHMRFAEIFVNPSLGWQADEKEFQATSKQEQQALDFAYSLLMPEREYREIVRRCTHDSVVLTKRVADYFHISFTDARSRGLDLGILEW